MKREPQQFFISWISIFIWTFFFSLHNLLEGISMIFVFYISIRKKLTSVFVPCCPPYKNPQNVCVRKVIPTDFRPLMNDPQQSCVSWWNLIFMKWTFSSACPPTGMCLPLSLAHICTDARLAGVNGIWIVNFWVNYTGLINDLTMCYLCKAVQSLGISRLFKDWGHSKEQVIKVLFIQELSSP